MRRIDETGVRNTPKVFVVCDQTDTAPIWGYILRQRGLTVILETSLDNALERWSAEIPDLAVIDVDPARQNPLDVCRHFRSIGLAPILLFLPNHHETMILDAYAAGVDDVVVKPISPAIFAAKIAAWVRRSWTIPVDRLSLISAGRYRLDPQRRCLFGPEGNEVRLTNLELQLLHLLMSEPGHVFNTDEIIRTIWGQYGTGDNVLLKNVVYRLRRKIESDPAEPILVQTWPGGYSFEG